MRLLPLGIALLMSLAVVAPGARGQDAAEARLAVDPLEATVGDRLNATVTVVVPPGWTLDTGRLGNQWGKFAVISGAWSTPVVEGNGQRWEWSGTLSAFEPGTWEIPSLELLLSVGEETRTVSTEPVEVSIVSVLSEQDLATPDAELADLKPPASIRPDYGPLFVALGILAALLAAAGILWWLHRRYASRLAAVPAPDDPFRRTPPDVWVYGELQKLLERRLPEQGQVDLFYVELSWILKKYLGGRFRLDLLEHTTSEVAGQLGAAGVGRETIGNVERLLHSCDAVKFAKLRPDPASCRAAVEEVYRIVDSTKVGERAHPQTAQGAA